MCTEKYIYIYICVYIYIYITHIGSVKIPSSGEFESYFLLVCCLEIASGTNYNAHALLSRKQGVQKKNPTSQTHGPLIPMLPAIFLLVRFATAPLLSLA